MQGRAEYEDRSIQAYTGHTLNARPRDGIRSDIQSMREVHELLAHSSRSGWLPMGTCNHRGAREVVSHGCYGVNHRTHQWYDDVLSRLQKRRAWYCEEEDDEEE